MIATASNSVNGTRCHRLRGIGDSEDFALGHALAWPDVWLGKLDPTLFEDSSNLAIARALIDANGDPAKILELLGDSIGPRGETEARLMELIELSYTSPAHARECFERLVRKRDDRHLKQDVQALSRAIEDGDARAGDIRERLAEIARDYPGELGVDDSLSLSQMMQSDPADEEDEHIRTGLAWFDSAMPNGALSRGDKVAFGAFPKVGKSALCLQLTLAALQTNEDLRAVWCMGEMTPKVLRNRSLQCVSGLSLGVLRRGWDDPGLSAEQARRKRGAIDTLRSIGQRLDILTAPLTPARIEQRIKATGAGWVVIDYIQLCATGEPGRTRRDDIDAVIRELTRMSQQYGCVMLIVSDMAKAAAHGCTILDAYKETSELGFACDVAYVGRYADRTLGDRVASGELMQMPAEVDIRWQFLGGRHGDAKTMELRLDRFSQRYSGAAE